MSILIVDSTRSIVEDGYHMTWSVASHYEIDPEVFVHKFGTNEFMHVASVHDMTRYGTSPDSEVGFYRQETASLTLDDFDKASSLVQIVEDRLDILVEDFDTVMGGFVGSSTSSHVF